MRQPQPFSRHSDTRVRASQRDPKRRGCFDHELRLGIMTLMKVSDPPGYDRGMALRLFERVVREPGLHDQAFDAYFYPLVYDIIRRRHRRAAAYAIATAHGGVGASIPFVPPHDEDLVAHDAVVTGLRRVRKRAARFNPRLGDPLDWVVRACALAYVDAARAASGARRAIKPVPASHELAEIVDRERVGADSAETALLRVQLEDCFGQLTTTEALALRLKYTYGLTYHQIAEAMYGSQEYVNMVDRLLRAAREKFKLAWRAADEEGAGEQPA